MLCTFFIIIIIIIIIKDQTTQNPYHLLNSTKSF